jgi:hypothetical protein
MAALSVIQPFAADSRALAVLNGGGALALTLRPSAAAPSAAGVTSSPPCPICHRQRKGRHRLGLYWRKFGYAGPEYCTRPHPTTTTTYPSQASADTHVRRLLLHRFDVLVCVPRARRPLHGG